MGTSRDPRIDPRPGDGVERAFATSPSGTILREVTDVRGDGSWVFYLRDNGHTAYNQIDYITAWRYWCRKATVWRKEGVDVDTNKRKGT